MKLVLSATMMTLAGSLAYGCHEAPIDSDSLDATSCPAGVYLDVKGKCRKPGGKFAKKACCAALATATHATKSRVLDAYTCPAGEELIPVAFFDADSTLRIARSGAVTANTKTDVFVLPFAASSIKKVNDQGYLVAIVSNQGGVAAGIQTFEVAEGALVYVSEKLHSVGTRIDYIDLADKKDEFRKPQTGMAQRLDDLLTDKCHRGIDFEASFMIGDAGYKEGVDGPHPDGRPADDFSNFDRGFAENLEIPFTEPNEYFGWRTWETFNIHDKEELVGLLEAVEATVAELDESGEDPARRDELHAEVAQNRALNDL